ncbi:MAG: phage recombination protein Bet [Opitutaceae bacterium]
MSTDTALQPAQKTNVPAIAGPRLPYHPGLKERFGVDQAEWRALVESTFPAARSVGAVILALAYCKARNLDPFKKTVHIVPIWDKERGCEVETVWPGIAEYRTTAARTGSYAGHDEVAHGPMIRKSWEDTDKSGKSHGTVEVEFPEWAQMTVYRLVQGNRCAFPGPKVYWLETYACKRNGCPNTMWTDRPIGMIDKCAEAAALRSAFPEELGGEASFEEWGGFRWNGRAAIDTTSEQAPQLEGPSKAKAETQQPSKTETKKPQESEAAPVLSDSESATVAQWKEEIGTLNFLADLAEARRTIPQTLSADAQQAIVNAVEMREAAVRGSRGDRSNAKQKSLVDNGGPSATESGM